MKLTTLQHKEVREAMANERSKKHWNKKDVEMIVAAKQSGDWKEVFASKLYNEYGGEYCSMLQVLNRLQLGSKISTYEVHWGSDIRDLNVWTTEASSQGEAKDNFRKVFGFNHIKIQRVIELD
jgi:hypothetical protein